ncbi:MAG TPA: DNA polymerase/3'-5' exonuclease PolX [Acidobacteriota bacterium]|nr:DNA polymerase/3'-5' exonuclease PolX [Acidobacteriota bacterium]
MENIEIARILNDYAELLEFKNENRFRVGSYRRAAQMIQSLSEPLGQMIAEHKDLTELPGVGKSMAEHITEIVQTGGLKALTVMRREFPASMSELLQLEGLGPKRTKQLYTTFKIRSIKELALAIDAGKLNSLPGFGKKSIEKLRQAIRTFEKRPKRFLLRDADQLVRPLIEYLRTAGGIEQLEVAGSYRRRMETVGDIDILVACENAEPVMQRFQAYPEVERVLSAGTTRGTVVLRSGLQVDLRVLPQSCYGAALNYFTGSKAHNIVLRTLGVERGLRISEYGIFRVPRGATAEESSKAEGERIGGAKEEDLYRILKLDYVPPELREDRGEIQAAREHKLPELIKLEDIRGDFHMHSKWTDGHNTIEEMMRACADLGYQYCCISDHSKAVRVAGGLGAKEFAEQRKEIEKLRSNLRGMKLLAGCEVDILPDGSLDLSDEILDQLDIVIAAVHSKMDMPQSEMTKRVLKALAHPAVTMLAHPTGRLINDREPFAIDLEEVFRAAKEYGVAIELNGQPQRLDLNDVYIHRAMDLGVKISLNTDAHGTEQLKFMKYGVDQARRGWLEKRHVLNTMTWPQLEKWLKQRRQRLAKAAAN